MDKPTPEEIRDAWMEETDDFEEVFEHADPSWRHGCYMTTVFKRLADDTYWAAFYTRTGDGEENGLREGDAEINQVWPHEVKTIEYRNRPPSESA